MPDHYVEGISGGYIWDVCLPHPVIRSGKISVETKQGLVSAM